MDRDTALDTYRYLRGGVPVMLVMLAAAVLIARTQMSGWLTSISAYYYTSAHAVFIGSICAMGAMLIVYKGVKPTEDVLLNVAGVLAFIVAFVPTTRPDPLLTYDAPMSTVLSNTWALVIALLVARVSSWLLYRRTDTAPKLGPIATAAVWGQRLLFAAGLLTLILAKDWFVANAHGIAAVLLFAAIAGTVFLTAFVADKGVVLTANPALYHRIYQAIAITMALTLLAAVIVHFVLSTFSHVVIVVEVVLLAEFFAYWTVQTIEKWKPHDAAPQHLSCTAREERVLNAL